jgi:hypothetical protein
MRHSLSAIVGIVLLVGGAAGARPAGSPGATLRPDLQALCRTVDRAAAADRLSAGFLTRILWQESRFRSDALSPKGAEGVAQFMPPTALDRGLANPWEPGPAIAAAGHLLAELRARFGNLGLAAAAYNAGAARVEKWLRAESGLPAETRNYVHRVTGRPVEEWVTQGAGGAAAAGDGADCATTIAELPRGAAPAGARPAALDRVLARALSLAERQGR